MLAYKTLGDTLSNIQERKVPFGLVIGDEGFGEHGPYFNSYLLDLTSGLDTISSATRTALVFSPVSLRSELTTESSVPLDFGIPGGLSLSRIVLVYAGPESSPIGNLDQVNLDLRVSVPPHREVSATMLAVYEGRGKPSRFRDPFAE